MTQMCGKWLKYVGNGLDIWSTAQVFEKLHKYVKNDLNILNIRLRNGDMLKWKNLNGLYVGAKYVLL